MEIIGLWFKVEKPEVFRKPIVFNNWIFLTLIENNLHIEYSNDIQETWLEPLINKRLQSVPSQIRRQTMKLL